MSCTSKKVDWGDVLAIERMPDIEILSRICNVFSVPADYLLGRTNTSAVRGKMKNVCELTGLSDAAAEFLSELLKHQRYGILDKLNYLLEEFANDCDEDYDMQGQRNLEDTSSILNALFGYMEKYSHFEDALDFVEVCCAIGEGKLWVITAYYPTAEIWENDMKTRKAVK